MFGRFLAKIIKISPFILAHLFCIFFKHPSEQVDGCLVFMGKRKYFSQSECDFRTEIYKELILKLMILSHIHYSDFSFIILTIQFNQQLNQ